MIKPATIKKEISDIEHRILHEEMKPATEKKLRNKIPHLNHLIRYVESEPSPEFIKSEIERIEAKINLRMAGFDTESIKDWAKKDFNKVKKEYEKFHEIPKLREQVRTLRYLLNE
jgi:hypothetical protein